MMRYIADAADAARMVELDGLTALYHRPSGTTHLLAAPAPQILEVIAGEAADPSEILALMAERFDIERGEGVLLALEARLDELEAAGLVRRA